MERDQLIQEMKEKMNRVEDDVFEDFCRQIGMQNIRQYEERELRSQQERAKKRLEFENQKNRIMNQLEFERMKDTKSMCFDYSRTPHETGPWLEQQKSQITSGAKNPFY